MKALKTTFIIFVAFMLSLVAAIPIAFYAAKEALERAGECVVGVVLTPLKWTVDVAKWSVDTLNPLGDSSLDGFIKQIQAEMNENAGIIISVGKARGRNDRDITVALMVALQESGLRMLDHGDRDSVNMFQQRPSQGWGTLEELMDPVYATNAFFEALEKVENREDKTYLEIALAVQRPDEAAYLSSENNFTDKQKVAEMLLSIAEPAQDLQTRVAVTIVGDSLTAATASQDPDNFALYGWGSVTVDGVGARRTTTQPESGTPESGLNAIKRLKDPEVQNSWVIALGTNDVAGVTTAADAEGLIRPVLDELGQNTPVMWVNIHHPKYQVGTKLFNDTLVALTQEYPNLKVLDWQGLVRDHPEWVTSDSVHYTVEGSKQRSGFIAGSSKFLRSTTYGNVINPEGNPESSDGVCDRGERFLNNVFGGISASIGHVMVEGDEYQQAGGVAAKAYLDAGLNIGATFAETKALSSVIPGKEEAVRGDLIYWGEDEATITQMGFYLGSDQVVLEPKVGETVSYTSIDWKGVVAILRPVKPSSAGTSGLAPDAPVDQITNPGLAEVARNFEDVVGDFEIRYGAPRPEWTSKGLKGNFGHGDKEQWLNQLSLGESYQAIDCSGFMNVVVYLAYGLDVYGCSYAYKSLNVGGQSVTTPLMYGSIDPEKLHAGDFIIKQNKECNEGSSINHIVMVLDVAGNLITTAESHAGENDGYEVRTRDASWYNTEWPDLVVSRWIGPGSQAIPQTAEVPDSVPSTTTGG